MVNIFFKKSHKQYSFVDFFFIFFYFFFKTNFSKTVVYLYFFFKLQNCLKIDPSKGIGYNEIFLKNISIFWGKGNFFKTPLHRDTIYNYVLFFWEKRHKTLLELDFFQNIEKYFTVSVCKNKFFLNLVRLNNVVITPQYSSSSISKNIYLSNLDKFEYQYLRKNKVYNKGRYSRCRQNFRTGVYMCMYLSIVSIFGLYYWFYKFSFNFTYLWWLFIVFVGSFFTPKILKYRFYEPKVLLLSILGFIKWLLLLIRNFF